MTDVRSGKERELSSHFPDISPVQMRYLRIEIRKHGSPRRAPPTGHPEEPISISPRSHSQDFLEDFTVMGENRHG
ncbi:MAG: hypothetical protein WCR85_04900 [Sphaerochaeta sp.]